MLKNRIYFASDFHLGIPNIKESHKREKLIVQWLESIKNNAHSIYLLGDIFDFWFEYEKVVPKGFVRVLGKLTELIENNTNIYLFTGNHDMWIKDYLEKEIGIQIYHGNKIIHLQNKRLFIGHGDGLAKGDYLYKSLKIIFKSKICQWVFSLLHPDFAFKIAHAWSKKSRKTSNNNNNQEDILINYCKKAQRQESVDYYIFGHNHNPNCINIDDTFTYINTGDWLSHNTYAILKGGNISLKKYNATYQE